MDLLSQSGTISAAKRVCPNDHDRSSLTGLDYAVNRTYSSSDGRFTQVDPLGMAASSGTGPQSLNLYAYTQNDPVNFTDPRGLLIAIPFIGSWSVDVRATWFDDLWENLWDAGNSGNFGWLNDPSSNGGIGGGGGAGLHERTHSQQPPLTQAECDIKIASIFGAPGAVAATAIEPNTLASRAAGAERSAHLANNGTFHIYTDSRGSSSIVGLYAPRGWIRTTGEQRVYFGKNDLGMEGELNYNYIRFYYTGGLSISFLHVGDTEIDKSDRNQAGSVRIGNIGGPGTGGEGGTGYQHSHVNVYRNGKRIDPRKVFCGW